MDKRLLDSFSYHLRMERQLSPNTVEAYVRDAGAFLESGFPEDTEGILSWFELLSGQGPAQTGGHSQEQCLSKRSQARTLSSLRSYYDFLVLEGERKDNPCDGIESPKLGRYLPEVLSVQEVEAILNSVDTSTPGGLRDSAILEVLYGCGLRVSEASTLKISGIYLTEGFVRIIGKGNKERIVPIGGPARDAVSRWLEVRPSAKGPEFDDILFLNRFGAPLSRVSIFKLVKTQAMLAGVRKEISPHSFRHSFATHMIENGADLRVVQEMLGHESILTTEIYTHIDSATWQSSILEHHPRK